MSRARPPPSRSTPSPSTRRMAEPAANNPGPVPPPVREPDGMQPVLLRSGRPSSHPGSSGWFAALGAAGPRTLVTDMADRAPAEQRAGGTAGTPSRPPADRPAGAATTLTATGP